MKRIFILICLTLGLIACGEKKEGPNLSATTPDVGKVEQVEVSAKGVGLTPGAAVNDALKIAVQQVNGTAVSATSANLNFAAKTTAAIDVESSEGRDSAKATASLQSNAFAEQIVTNSNGLVSSFEVVSLIPPGKSGDQFTVQIKAKIAKFKGPADTGKVKIVVMPLRSDRPTFNIGGNQIPAEQILGPVKQKIIDALSQNGRFTVLDRDFGAEVQGELGMITSGQTSNIDMAKLSQALSADIVWVGTVNTLAYEKNVRKLQTSDRDLVSFSGSWSISQRLVNLATRQIMAADTLNGDFPKVGPTTLGASINEANTLNDLTASIAKKATNAIMMKTFPISIVQIDGDTAVLSQGQGALQPNTKYKVYLLGKELKDPQTGQSLGNSKSECCEILVNNVDSKVAYGTLSNVKIKLDGFKPGTLQLGDQILVAPPESAVQAQQPAPTPPQATTQQQPAQPKQPSKKKDSDW